MNDRGFGLVDAMAAVALMGVVGMAASGMLVSLPPQVSAWSDAADARQRLRVVEARVAEITARAVPIVVDIGGQVVRVPAVWPRRLGFWRAEDPAVVSSSAVTIVARTDGHRRLTTADALGAAGGTISIIPAEGCGAAEACALAAGDLVLLLSAAGECALHRVVDSDARIELAALMPGGPAFDPGSILLPVVVTVISFEAGDEELRFYDGYRSDNVLLDGATAFQLSLESGGAPAFAGREWGGSVVDGYGVARGSGRLGDGPFVGTGPMAFDVDQLFLNRIVASLAVGGVSDARPRSAQLEWGTPPWPWPPPSS